MPKLCKHTNCSYPVFSTGYCQSHWRSEIGSKKPYADFSRPKLLRFVVNAEKKPIKKISDRQKKLDVLYGILRKSFLRANPSCQMRIKCMGSEATDVHHSRGRGEYYLDETTFIAGCRECHTWVGDHHAEAEALGFVKSRLSRTN